MKGGFACLPFSWAAVRPYDIISVYRPGGHHHAEIYYGKINGRDYSYGWGNVHDGINGHAGMPHPTTKYNDYQLIWRHNGTSIDSYDVNNDAPKSTLGYWTVLADDKNAYKNGLYTVANNCIPKLRSFSFMILCSGINRI